MAAVMPYQPPNDVADAKAMDLTSYTSVHFFAEKSQSVCNVTIFSMGCGWNQTSTTLLKSDDVEPPQSCPADYRLLWNGICQPTKNWPPNKELTREVVTPEYLTRKPPVINVTIGRQLFVDSFLVQNANNIKTTFHAPEFDNDTINPVLKSTRSWEVRNVPSAMTCIAFENTNITLTEQVGETAGGLAGTAKAVGVWWVEAKRHYEMFYRCGSHSLCLAYSDDAIVWTKPMIDNGFKSCGGEPCNSEYCLA